MSDLLSERDGAILTLTLNRPERMNTISQSLLSALSAALIGAGADPEVRVIVLTGAGRAFCAGLDLEDAASEEGVAKSGFQLTATLADRDFAPLVLHRLDKPVICAINGGAAGFGLDLALGCDIRFAASHARLAAAFTRRGILPETGGTWYLPRLLGWSRAAELVFAGRTLTAAQALELGLVDHVVEGDALPAAARALAAEIAACAPLAVQAAKRLFRAGLSEDLGAHIDRAYLQMLPLMRSEDFREGFNAFLQKRPPEFHGR
ncbi:MAG: enoyl-CoA hydratase/isomerase family protein [Gammaproteobacteria bacterium]|nr:enoyl-CoA hydratase/isomerase family protein [Gammaproteobacteria bacterium]